jgi:hypothetical protein
LTKCRWSIFRTINTGFEIVAARTSSPNQSKTIEVENHRDPRKKVTTLSNHEYADHDPSSELDAMSNQMIQFVTPKPPKRGTAGMGCWEITSKAFERVSNCAKNN